MGSTATGRTTSEDFDQSSNAYSPTQGSAGGWVTPLVIPLSPDSRSVVSSRIGTESWDRWLKYNLESSVFTVPASVILLAACLSVMVWGFVDSAREWQRLSRERTW
jgi:hypothetical protein